MTLTIYNAEDIPQGSDGWLEARRGIVTASTVGKLLTSTGKVANNDTSRALVNTLVAERLTGHVEYVHPTPAMMRGTLDEPFARDAYAQHYGPVEEVGFYRLETDAYVAGYSPDGVTETGGLLEIKSRSPHIHMRTILEDRVPAANMGQLQMGMFVSGKPWIDYLSWSGGMAIWVKRIEPDPAWFASIEQSLTDFERTADAIADQYKRNTRGAPIAPRIDHYAEEAITFG